MKDKVSSTYWKRLKLALKSKLNLRNVVHATWAVTVIRYSGAILNWTQAEVEELDWRSRELLALKVEYGQT